MSAEARAKGFLLGLKYCDITLCKIEGTAIYLSIEKGSENDNEESISRLKGMCLIHGFERLFLKKV